MTPRKPSTTESDAPAADDRNSQVVLQDPPLTTKQRFLTKPVDRAELCERVRDLVASRRLV